MPLFGAHMSIAGGLPEAFKRIKQVGGQALQIFTKNQRQWLVPELTNAEIESFSNAFKKSGNIPVAAHDSYLINLANPSDIATKRSINAFATEIVRCHRLQVPFLIMHPGSHLGSGIKNGLATLTANLDIAIEKAEVNNITILLETTAGQGSGLGVRFEEIASVLEHSRYQNKLGVCFDTCHSFAAGYDLRTPKAYEQTFGQFDKYIGLERLKFFHVNDSKKELGSRIDRHEHIGKGKIGLTGFSLLVNDPRFKDHPMVLETPKDKDLSEDKENLEVLRGLLEKN